MGDGSGKSGGTLFFVRTLFHHIHIRHNTILHTEPVLDRRALTRRRVPIVVEDLKLDIRLVGAGDGPDPVGRVLVLDRAPDWSRTCRHPWRHRGAICARRRSRGGVLHAICPC